MESKKSDFEDKHNPSIRIITITFGRQTDVYYSIEDVLDCFELNAIGSICVFINYIITDNLR